MPAMSTLIPRKRFPSAITAAAAAGDQRGRGHGDTEAGGAARMQAAGRIACTIPGSFQGAMCPRVLGGEDEEPEEDDEDAGAGQHEHDQPGAAQREPDGDDGQSFDGRGNRAPALGGEV